MSIRTTPAKCDEICHVDTEDGIAWTGFIAMGSSLTDKVTAADSDSELDSTDLELIERNLACHFRGMRDQYLQSKSEGGASGQFKQQSGMHLDGTDYGQAAMTLDITGYLSKINQQAKKGKQQAGLEWVGTEYEDDQAAEYESQWST